jgi:hypothetical protein
MTGDAPGQRFLADVVALGRDNGDGWYQLTSADDDSGGTIGQQIKIARNGDRLEIVGYATFNR